MTQEGAGSYIDFLEKEFSGEADSAGDAAPGSHQVQALPMDWDGVRSSIAPRSRCGPLFGVTQRDIDRAWEELSRDPELLIPQQRFAKRLFDLTASTLLIIFLAPLFATAYVAIKLDSPGPAIFRQTRVGVGGRRFSMYKFRTMRTDNETVLASLADGAGTDGVLFKLRRDPRITRVGRFLRRFSLDELPELVNVLRGDMSLVGPRPALSVEVALYDSVTRRRLLVKPGLTGLWQISGRSDLSWEEAVRLDLHYAESSGFLLDMSIILRTVSVIFSGRGAY